MTTIRITDKVIGEGLAYTEKNKGGEKLKVQLYEMTVNDSSIFNVARDSQSSNPPCPPNRKDIPYLGKIRTDGEKGFRVELYEEGLSETNDTLQGVGDKLRTHIQIHKGPGYSEGCFLLTGDEKGRDGFRKVIEESGAEEIEIWVEQIGYKHNQTILKSVGLSCFFM